MKICSTSLKIKELLCLNTDTIFHFLEWQNDKSLMEIHCWHGFLHAVGGNINWYSFFNEPFGIICQNVKYTRTHTRTCTHTHTHTLRIGNSTTSHLIYVSIPIKHLKNTYTHIFNDIHHSTIGNSTWNPKIP